jgi:hypothetical protein
VLFQLLDPLMASVLGDCQTLCSGSSFALLAYNLGSKTDTYTEPVATTWLLFSSSYS